MRIKNNDPRIDTAIESYPLVELPDGFATRIITTIREEHPRIRFRLQFIDLVLPMFMSLFSLILLGICSWGMIQLDPLQLEYFKLEISHFLRIMTPEIGFEVDLIILFIMMALLVGSLLIVWLIYRPRKILRI
jgi:hypothetical protein